MSTPVAPAMTGRRGLWRWAVALVATVLLVVSGSGLVVFAQSGAGESKGPVFVPADAPIYIEARLDMPEGQDEALAQLMTAFPGFTDPGTFEMKVDEILNGVAGEASPEGDIIGDALTGEIGIAITDLESAMANEEPTMLMGMAIADPAMAEQMAEALSSGAGMEAVTSQEMLGDTTVVSDMTSSAAIHGEWMLFSNDAEQVKAAIEVLDGDADSLADDADFATAFSRVPSARLGAVYVNMQSFGSFFDMAGALAAGQTGIDLPLGDLGDLGDLAAMLPKDMVMYLAAENDRLNLEAFVTPGEATPEVPIGDSELASLFPAETQLYVETRELGTTVEAGLTGLAEMLAAQQELMPADDEMGAMGSMSDIEMLFSEDSPIATMLGAPLPQFLDFVVDAGVGAGLSRDGLWLGIAGEVSDEAVAAKRLKNVVSLVTLLGGDPVETGISVVPETVNDVEVTKIMVPLDEMVAESGVPINLGDSISVAVDDGYLLIGLGDFVQSAIMSEGSDSLGSSAGYADALGEDTVNSGVLYVNISSLLAELDPMLSMMSPEWSEIAPYATGLDRMIAVGTAEDEVIRSRMTIIVGQ